MRAAWIMLITAGLLFFSSWLAKTSSRILAQVAAPAPPAPLAPSQGGALRLAPGQYQGLGAENTDQSLENPYRWNAAPPVTPFVFPVTPIPMLTPHP